MIGSKLKNLSKTKVSKSLAMKLLALDCSSEACSVALLQADSIDAKAIISEQFEMAARQHTQRLLPMVEQVLAAANCSLQQLDAIAFGRGPGSFTGLRICLGAVQGLALAADLPVLPVSSLAAQAKTAIDEGLVSDSELIISSFDARMDEVYWACYQRVGQSIERIGEERLTAPELVTSPDNIDKQRVALVGSGCDYGKRITDYDGFQLRAAELLPRASAVAALACVDFFEGRMVNADQALPQYLRDDVTWKKQSPAVG
ncbi:MAG: tRNA threonylcarbamoyladenosine biosynthesis protein TsaB [Oceanicoccus sp.]